MLDYGDIKPKVLFEDLMKAIDLLKLWVGGPLPLDLIQNTNDFLNHSVTKNYETGGWTESPPIKPGWYKAIRYKEVIIVKIISDKIPDIYDNKLRIDMVGLGYSSFIGNKHEHGISMWWSEPIDISESLKDML